MSILEFLLEPTPLFVKGGISNFLDALCVSEVRYVKEAL